MHLADQVANAANSPFLDPHKSCRPSPTTHRISEAQKKFYHDNRYLLGLPAIYTRPEMAALNAPLPNLLAFFKSD